MSFVTSWRKSNVCVQCFSLVVIISLLSYFIVLFEFHKIFGIFENEDVHNPSISQTNPQPVFLINPYNDTNTFNSYNETHYNLPINMSAFDSDEGEFFLLFLFFCK